MAVVKRRPWGRPPFPGRSEAWHLSRAQNATTWEDKQKRSISIILSVIKHDPTPAVQRLSEKRSYRRSWFRVQSTPLGKPRNWLAPTRFMGAVNSTRCGCLAKFDAHKGDDGSNFLHQNKSRKKFKSRNTTPLSPTRVGKRCPVEIARVQISLGGDEVSYDAKKEKG